jgi:hypothetical protein
VKVTTTSTRFADDQREIAMSIAWGTALDAEVAYRHQQVRNDYHRWTWRRKPAQHVSAQHVSAQHVPAQHVSAQHVSAQQVSAQAHHSAGQQIPAQRVPAPLIPVRPRPVDQELTSAHAA